MDLGAFSISLNVKDVRVSKAFYEKLGFESFEGDIEQNWIIMKNGQHVIGLFQGMFPRNTLTFNPGWDQSASPVGSFTDVRELKKEIKAYGITVNDQADEDDSGPANFLITDPDGNPILFDQHV